MSIVSDILAGLGAGAGNAATGGVPAAVSAVSGLAESVVKRIWPDPEQTAEREAALEKLRQEGWLEERAQDVQIAIAQSRVNEVEAGNACLFVSGWRPAAGWACVAAMVWNYIAIDIVNTGINLAGGGYVIQRMDISELLGVLFGMLGLVHYRTREKSAGVARSAL